MTPEAPSCILKEEESTSSCKLGRGFHVSRGSSQTVSLRTERCTALGMERGVRQLACRQLCFLEGLKDDPELRRPTAGAPCSIPLAGPKRELKPPR